MSKQLNMRKIYLRLVYDYWRRTLPRYARMENGVTVLECGTGPGNLISLMEDWFPEASFYGLDIDCQVLIQANKGTRESFLLVASAEMLPFPEQKFDIIISLHMIEHLAEPQRFLWEAARVLRPGGILVLATPNPEGIGARLMGSRWKSWHPEHLSLKPPEEWREMLANYGFLILRDGTTGLSGIPVFRKLPLALLNWGLLFLFGFFPWRYGEAYICLSRKKSTAIPHDRTIK